MLLIIINTVKIQNIPPTKTFCQPKHSANQNIRTPKTFRQPKHSANQTFALIIQTFEHGGFTTE